MMDDKPNQEQVKAKAKELEAATKKTAEGYKEDAKDKYYDAKVSDQFICYL